MKHVNYIDDLHLENDNFVENSNLNSSEFNYLWHYNNFDIQNRIVDKVASFFAKLLSNYGLPRNRSKSVSRNSRAIF